MENGLPQIQKHLGSGAVQHLGKAQSGVWRRARNLLPVFSQHPVTQLQRLGVKSHEYHEDAIRWQFNALLLVSIGGWDTLP